MDCRNEDRGQEQMTEVLSDRHADFLRPIVAWFREEGLGRDLEFGI